VAIICKTDPESWMRKSRIHLGGFLKLSLAVEPRVSPNTGATPLASQLLRNDTWQQAG